VKISEIVKRARARGACENGLQHFAVCETWGAVAASPDARKWLEWAIGAKMLPDACAVALAEYEATLIPAWEEFVRARVPVLATVLAARVSAPKKCRTTADPVIAKHWMAYQSVWAKYLTDTAPALTKCLSACVAILEREPGDEK
jgi:hypothetical protein